VEIGIYQKVRCNLEVLVQSGTKKTQVGFAYVPAVLLEKAASVAGAARAGGVSVAAR
jgi:hypothetical protein